MAVDYCSYWEEDEWPTVLNIFLMSNPDYKPGKLNKGYYRRRKVLAGVEFVVWP